MNSRIRMLLPLVVAPLLSSCAPKFERPSFVLVVVDTLRADALGSYGSPDADTPALDALAAQGLQFRTCVAQAPWTLPAVGSILTGRYPSAHGANRIQRAVAPGAPLLAENLRSSGFTTAAFVSNHFLQEKYGLHRGFDHFDDSFVGDEQAVTSAALTDAAVEWIRTAKRPFFLFLFYMDPHYDYMRHEGLTRTGSYDGPVQPGADIWDLRERAPELTAADRAQLRELYAGEVRAVDRAIGRLQGTLEDEGIADSSFLLLTADHGEELLDHGWIGHTRNLFAALLDVPFILRSPDWIEPELRADAAMLIDVFPTALQCLGLAPTPIPGRGVLAQDRSERPLYAEVTYDPQVIPPQQDPEQARSRDRELTKVAHMRSIQEGRWKAIRNALTETWSLYDLATDPGETHDVAADRAGVLEQLRAKLPEPGSFDVPESEATVGISPEELERLRGLGYVQ